MTSIADLLIPERIVISTQITSKKRSLELLSKLLSTGCDESQENILKALFQREKLGSTLIGHGIALPHARLAKVTQPLGAYLKVLPGITDFSDNDETLTKQFFALLVPLEGGQEAHLRIFAALAEGFSESQKRQFLEKVNKTSDIFDIFSKWPCPDCF
jgi:PTS system nitrogen regulatory IIA component